MFAQTSLDTAVTETSNLVESLPAVVVALIVFALLRFVFKAALIVVIIGTLVALVLSGAISFTIL